MRRQVAGGTGLLFFTLFFLFMALLNGNHPKSGANVIAAIFAGMVALGCAFVFSYVRITVKDHLNEQLDEDTCAEHGVFCCPQCFDMSDQSRDPGTETEE